MQRLPDTITILACTPATPRIGDRVRVTKTSYTSSIYVGCTGVVVYISPHDGVYNISRDDMNGIGWCEECVCID